MTEKLTLEEFRARYARRRWTDEDLADAAIAELPSYVPLVQASRDFLEACRAFDAAVEAAGVQRD